MVPAILSSAPVQKQIKAKRFTQDIIDSLGDRIYELILFHSYHSIIFALFVFAFWTQIHIIVSHVKTQNIVFIPAYCRGGNWLFPVFITNKQFWFCKIRLQARS